MIIIMSLAVISILVGLFFWFISFNLYREVRKEDEKFQKGQQERMNDVFLRQPHEYIQDAINGKDPNEKDREIVGELVSWVEKSVEDFKKWQKSV